MTICAQKLSFINYKDIEEATTTIIFVFSCIIGLQLIFLYQCIGNLGPHDKNFLSCSNNENFLRGATERNKW